MIDANLNRTREGLRVMEDCARFALNSTTISTQLKHARHALGGSINGLNLPPDALLHARDTRADVGTNITTPSEQQRPGGMRDLVSAAAKRATEALRVIEESVKTFGAPGTPFESLRYTIYTLERELIRELHPPCPQWTLCVLVTQSLCTHHLPAQVIELAHAGGADCIQLREKTMPDARFLSYADPLTRLAQRMGLHVIINDRVHIARLVGADGVHLGQDDLPTSAARELLAHGRWIGRTCPTIEHAIHAIEQGADTCGLGPVFPSTTKSKPSLAGTTLIESYLRDPRTRSTPMLAISGINQHNIGSLAQINCPGVAVSSAVCSSPHPQSVCRAIVNAITRHQGMGDATISP